MSAHPFWKVSWRLYRVRKAWCELTTGHDFSTWGAFMRRDTDLASKVRLECRICGKGTAWIDTPERDRHPATEEDAV